MALSGFEFPALSKTSAIFKLSINMQQGVGISLISNAPEELLYLTMNGVNVNLSANGSEQDFALTMQKFQVSFENVGFG